MKYEARFTMLVRYAAQLCYGFLRGLKDELRHLLVPLSIQGFFELVERARLAENNLVIPQFRQKMNRKRACIYITGGESSENRSRFDNFKK
ncbi:hypothetical protein IEQ34_004618 [Dendrobium chrysotoxum]|uniref:Uncharacterized protein n=1 Tax=Dendrobium chrysotoxum TaxID=161865 RepID=A0AAV7HGW4_DENCH|nr:hypothetical protein IEQ34_004618 [Dendrobium chrysotoxum]